MEQKTLSKWLKCIIIGTGVCGLIFFFFIVPSFGQDLLARYPEFSYCYWPWLIFLWISGIPCYTVLVLAWKIVVNIGRDRSFSSENAKLFQWISYVTAVDTAFFFGGNVVLLLLNMSHPAVTLLSLIVVFVGVAVIVASAALSHLVNKAADLQEQSDLTI
ncbi:MAG: DUF2975 domain-containing protein [Lachnospiraceae bacterium]|nr:DUF2975 domain-containing protein [Lachnospiraceae bacterium]